MFSSLRSCFTRYQLLPALALAAAVIFFAGCDSVGSGSEFEDEGLSSATAEAPPTLHTRPFQTGDRYFCMTRTRAPSGTLLKQQVALGFPEALTATGSGPAAAQRIQYRLYASGQGGPNGKDAKALLRAATCRIPATAEAEALVQKQLRFPGASRIEDAGAAAPQGGALISGQGASQNDSDSEGEVYVEETSAATFSSGTGCLGEGGGSGGSDDGSGGSSGGSSGDGSSGGSGDGGYGDGGDYGDGGGSGGGGLPGGCCYGGGGDSGGGDSDGGNSGGDSGSGDTGEGSSDDDEKEDEKEDDLGEDPPGVEDPIIAGTTPGGPTLYASTCEDDSETPWGKAVRIGKKALDAARRGEDLLDAKTWKNIAADEWADAADAGYNTYAALNGDMVALLEVLNYMAGQIVGVDFFGMLDGLKIADRLGFGWYDDVTSYLTSSKYFAKFANSIDDLGTLKQVGQLDEEANGAYRILKGDAGKVMDNFAEKWGGEVKSIGSGRWQVASPDGNTIITKYPSSDTPYPTLQINESGSIQKIRFGSSTY